MGHDIVPIGRHTLNTQNVEVLAYDLFQRMNINIRYGFRASDNLTQLLGDTFGDHEFVQLGTLLKDNSLPTFRLTHDEHQNKAAVEKFGIDIIHDPRYHFLNRPPDAETIQRSLDELQFNNYDFYREDPLDKDSFGRESMYIYDHLYVDHMDYFSRWWNFCGIFTGKEEVFNPDALLRFRKNLRKDARSMGSDKVYYLDDQSSVMDGVGQSEEYRLSWEELESFVKERAGELLLDISRYIKDPVYKKTADEWKDDPLAFVDDFSDLMESD